MPNCFTLTRRSDMDAGPVPLNQIDQEMCEHFNVPCDPKLFHNGWYNYIGIMLACGRTWEQLRDRIADHFMEAGSVDESECWMHMEDIRAWLEEHFVENAWCER